MARSWVPSRPPRLDFYPNVKFTRTGAKLSMLRVPHDVLVNFPLNGLQPALDVLEVIRPDRPEGPPCEGHEWQDDYGHE